MTALKKLGSRLSRHDRNKLLLELIVVFLGVTAGFLMNNWRVQKVDKDLENKYINSFLSDLDYNIPEIETTLHGDSLWIMRARPHLEGLRDGLISEDSAIAVLSMVANIYRLEENTGTYEDIIGSGNLNILRNFEQKAAIVDYHMTLNGLQFLEDYFYSYFSDFVMPFIFREFNVVAAEFSNPGVIQTIEFSNVFAGYYSMIQQRIAAYENLLEKSYELKKLLTEAT